MEEIAEVYARSLFEVAQDEGQLDEIHQQLGEFADVLSKNRGLQLFFFSPYFSSGEKKDGVAKVIEGGNEYFVRFLELLAAPLARARDPQHDGLGLAFAERGEWHVTAAGVAHGGGVLGLPVPQQQEAGRGAGGPGPERRRRG